jgi:FkbM family methyltransferase
MAFELARRGVRPLKKRLLRELDRRGYELVAGPFAKRVARMIDHLGIDTVIDGGANIGQYAQGLRAAGYTGRIVSLEPLSSAYARLSAAASADPRWTAERTALSDRPGEITMNVSANSVSSSALPMLAAHSDVAPTSAYVGTESASATTVDALVERLDLDPARTLLKLDVQGYENTVLDGASQTIGAFCAAQIELSYVPLYAGQWLAPQTVSFFEAHGYELWMLDPAVMFDPVTGRTLQCDGVFARA